MDSEHASIARCLFFSQAEKNQKAQRRGGIFLTGDGTHAALDGARQLDVGN